MKWRLLHATVLAGLNLASIGAGYFAWKLSGSGWQADVQLPVAFVLNVVACCVWILLCEWCGWGRGSVAEPLATLWIFGLAFVAAPVIFVPVHYLFTGYLTSLGNIFAIWPCQFFTNLVACAVAIAASRRHNRALCC